MPVVDALESLRKEFPHVPSDLLTLWKEGDEVLASGRVLDELQTSLWSKPEDRAAIERHFAHDEDSKWSPSVGDEENHSIPFLSPSEKLKMHTFEDKGSV